MKHKPVLRWMHLLQIMLISGPGVAFSASLIDKNPITDTPSDDAVTLSIVIEGHSLDRELDIRSLLIVHEDMEPSHAELTIQFVDMLPHAAKDYSALMNKKIEISAGYDSRLESVFAGQIISQQISLLPNEPFLWILQCENKQTATIAAVQTGSAAFVLHYGSTALNFELSMDQNKTVEGSVPSSGTGELLPGAVIKLDGFSPGYNKSYLVMRSEQRIDSKGWRTTVHIKQK